MRLEDIDYIELIDESLVGGMALTATRAFTSSHGATAKSGAVSIGTYAFTTTDTHTAVYSDIYVSGSQAGAFGGAISATRLNIRVSASVDASTYVSFKPR